MNIVYRKLRSTFELTSDSQFRFAHPVFSLLRLRPVLAQHTREESEVLRMWARGKRSIVEIGVAEGASALAIREVMAVDGALYLVDPYFKSRFPFLNSVKRVARRTLDLSKNGRIVWIENVSNEAAADWDAPIEFLFIDGDHTEPAVWNDWKVWSPFVVPNGVVAFHDARVFAGGWTSQDDGPVRVVDQLFRRENSGFWEIVAEVHSLVVVKRSA